MAKNRKLEANEQSSDEEELFSYLKKIHDVKQQESGADTKNTCANESDDRSHINQTGDTGKTEDSVQKCTYEKETEHHKAAQSDANRETESVVDSKKLSANKSDDCLKMNSDIYGRDTSNGILDRTNKTLQDGEQNSDTDKVDTKWQIAAKNVEQRHIHNSNERKNLKHANEKTERKSEKQNEITRNIETEALPNDLGTIKEVDVNALKEGDEKVQGKVGEQTPEKSKESDKYYLINEKDWLSLCAKLSDTEKINLEEKQQSQKTDLLETDKSRTDKSCDQFVTGSALVESKHQSVKGKSMFSAFKRYSPVSKAPFKRINSDQTPQKNLQTSEVISDTKKQNNYYNEQTLSGNEKTVSTNGCKISGEPKIVASPKVEIVYIRLEDGQIRYDASKSPLPSNANAEETNHQAVKKLNFSEHKQENTVLHRSGNTATHSMQNSSVGNDNGRNSSDTFPKAVEDNHDTCDVSDTHCDTAFKRGMQVRFVRIDNKLTRVYENVEHNVGAEVLGTKFIEGCNEREQDLHFREHTNIEHSFDDDNDSFNFDDSQLVAFPLNAIDPEMIDNDESLVQLTPSKLEMLNTSSYQDPLTLSKLTPNKIDPLTPSKLDVLSESELDVFGDEIGVKKSDEYHSSLDQCTIEKSVYTTDVLNEKIETEVPIVLKVTKSGELVECKSNETSPLKKEHHAHEPDSNVRTSGKGGTRQRSHIQTLWKTFKPKQVENKAKSNREENLNDDKKPIEKNTNRSEQSSDEDDLTNYFSMKKNTTVGGRQSNDVLKKKIDKSVHSVSIQASFPDSSDDKDEDNERLKLKNKTVERKFIDFKDGKKNIRSRAAKATDNNQLNEYQTHRLNLVGSEEQIVFKNDSFNIGKTTKSLEDNENNNILDTDSFTGSKEKILKRKKGNTQIRHFYQDCHYKQVDFKDFQSERQTMNALAMGERKGEIDLNIEERTVVEDHTDIENLKDKDQGPSADKVNKVLVRKRKLNIDKKVKQKKVIVSPQGKSKGCEKPCLKRTCKLKGNDLKKEYVEKTNTDTKPEGQIDDRSETDLGDESQRKIDFLEKLFQIKLKQAAVDTSQRKNGIPESSYVKTLHDQNKKNRAGKKSKDTNKSLITASLLNEEIKVQELQLTAEERLRKDNQVNIINKKQLPDKKRRKRRENEKIDYLGFNENKEESSNKCHSGRTAEGSGSKYKKLKENGKDRYRQGQAVHEICEHQEKDTTGVRKNIGTKRIKNLDKTIHPDMKKRRGRPRKLIVTLGTQMQGRKNKAQTEQTISKCNCYQIENGNAGSKSNTRRTRKKDIEKLQESLIADEPISEETKRLKDKQGISGKVDKMEFTQIKGRKKRTKGNNTPKIEKVVESKSLSSTLSDQSGFGENIEEGPDNSSESNKMNSAVQLMKESRNKRHPRKTRVRKTRNKEHGMNTVNNIDELDSVKRNGPKSSCDKGKTHLAGGNGDHIDKTTTGIIHPENTLLNHDQSQSSVPNELNSQNGIVSIVATFQPLEDSSQKPVNKTKILKRKKKESDDQVINKSKKMKIQTLVGDTSLVDTKKVPKFANKNNKRKSESENIFYSDADKGNAPEVGVSYPRKDSEEKESSASKDKHKNPKPVSPKKLRTGKILQKSSTEQQISNKTLKSARKPYASRKLKSLKKRHEKESWKEMLDDEPFKLDFNEKVNEEHKPINVRHVIKNILKSVKVADKTERGQLKHSSRKGKIHKHDQSSDGNIKQRVASESDDAWLGDSGPSVLFPAFKFSGISDAGEKKQCMIDNPLEISVKVNNHNSESELDESGIDRVTVMSDSLLIKHTNALVESNYMELHHSPLKVSSSQESNSLSSESSMNFTSTETIKLEGNSKESPEIIKNVDKLRALLDKVSDNKVVRNIEFADSVSSSDTDY